MSPSDNLESKYKASVTNSLLEEEEDWSRLNKFGIIT